MKTKGLTSIAPDNVVVNDVGKSRVSDLEHGIELDGPICASHSLIIIIIIIIIFIIFIVYVIIAFDEIGCSNRTCSGTRLRCDRG